MEVDPDVGASFDESGSSIRLEIRNQNPGGTEYSLSILRVEIDDESDNGFSFGIVAGKPQGFQFVFDYTDVDSISSMSVGLRSSF